jgi:hypothetical protein
VSFPGVFPLLFEGYMKEILLISPCIGNLSPSGPGGLAVKGLKLIVSIITDFNISTGLACSNYLYTHPYN